ncbi:MAG: PQQ-binding-like beta-propeller repeat protein, partial [Verrucomicrobiota bacterium]
VLSLPSGNLQGYEWSYIGVDDASVFGSSVKAASAYKEFWGKGGWFDSKTGGAGTEKVCSDNLFAYDKTSGRLKWTYENGMILNTTISRDEGRVYFVESRNPAMRKLNSGRIGDAGLWSDQFLVALDADSGKVIWDKPVDTEDGVLVFYMQVSKHGLIVTSSRKQYHLYNFSPQDGSLRWSQVSRWPNDHHSGHIQHPVIMGDKLFLQPNGFDLRTGHQIESRVGAREGCTTYIGSTGALIYRGRGRQVSMWDPESGKVTYWNKLRPSCWLNIITAGGLLQIPEGGAGCSCGKWIETSLSFGPKELLGVDDE